MNSNTTPSGLSSSGPTAAAQPFGPSEREIAIRKRVRREAEFWRHAMVYALVNGAVLLGFALYAAYSGKARALWASAPMAFGWGIGLAVHAITVYGRLSVFDSEWEERKVRQLLDKDRS
jgi:hypothetical protein